MPGNGGRIDSPLINATVVGSNPLEPRPPVEEENLSGLLKADLVERAEAAGIDPAGMTKAEIVGALEGADTAG